jgi:hypothetical protein
LAAGSRRSACVTINLHENEYLGDVFWAFDVERQKLRGFELRFMDDNHNRYQQNDEAFWLSTRQWEIVNKIAEDKLGVDVRLYMGSN